MLSLDTAQQLLGASLDKAKAMGLEVSVVVVDEGGHIRAAARMDGARFLTVDIAHGKANAVVGFHRTGLELAAFAERAVAMVNGLAVASHGRFFTSQGGVRIIIGGEEIGAVGVSGGSAEQDLEIAEAGIAAVMR